jgi:hypothetical protein
VRGSDVSPFIMSALTTNEHDPMHWRRCAEETRRNAEKIVDPVARKVLIQIADAYEQLATLAEAKLATNK